MRLAGLEDRGKKCWRKTTVAYPEAEAAKDLIQHHFGPTEEIDRRYVGDIAYITTWEGWGYLATVIDLASRRVGAGVQAIVAVEQLARHLSHPGVKPQHAAVGRLSSI